MNQEQVIALAREAGFDTDAIALDIFMTCKLDKLERFAALVAEATKSKYEKKFDEVFGELIEKIKGGMSAESAIRSLK